MPDNINCGSSHDYRGLAGIPGYPPNMGGVEHPRSLPETENDPNDSTNRNTWGPRCYFSLALFAGASCQACPKPVSTTRLTGQVALDRNVGLSAPHFSTHDHLEFDDCASVELAGVVHHLLMKAYPKAHS